jgi:hypothetical protein
MAGAALRGMGKVLAKHLKKAPALGGRVRKTGTIRLGQDVKGGKLTPKQSAEMKRLEDRIEARTPRPTILIGGYEKLKYIRSAKKRSQELAKKSHKERKEKLTKAIEEHKKKTKEKREKYGKHHG